MAAPDLTVSRLGQANLGGDVDALFLKVYAGEVLTAFETACVTKDKHRIRSISSGKSAAFPNMWKATAAYHTAGTMLVGQTVAQNERIITIDGLLVSDISIANIDEAMTHFDVRSMFTTEQGNCLALTYDQQVLQIGLLTARAAGNVGSAPSGTNVTDVNMKVDADILAASIMTSAKELDENDVPDGDRYVFLRPAQYWLLLNSDLIINKDITQGGSVQKGKVYEIGGVEVVKTNALPITNINSGLTKYQGNFTTTAGLVMHKSAVGTVTLIDMALESQYLIQNQGTLMVAKYAIGHGILRPESAVELKTA